MFFFWSLVIERGIHEANQGHFDETPTSPQLNIINSVPHAHHRYHRHHPSCIYYIKVIDFEKRCGNKKTKISRSIFRDHHGPSLQVS